MSSVSPQKRLVHAVRRPLAIVACLSGLSSAALTGCFDPDDGREPPLDRIYFPTGIALSPDNSRLYVANSNWDLQFNAGSVQVYDAARLRELLPRYCMSDAECTGAGQRCDLLPSADASGVERAPTHWCVDAASSDPCGGLGMQSAAERSTSPGLCSAFDNRDTSLLLASVRVGAFATDLLYRENPAGGGRLFVPVRSDATLSWMDVAGAAGTGRAELDCGQGTSDECDTKHRQGDSQGEATSRGDELPIEPFGVDATADGTAIVITHQTEGQISLFTNDWEQPDVGPRLSFILEGLPARPVVVSAIPVPEIAAIDRDSPTRQLGYRPGFWLGYRGGSFITLVRYYDAFDAPDGVPFLESAFSDRLTTTSLSDIRGMAVDDSSRRQCEVGCAQDATCLGSCAGVALDVYMSNSAPASLLTGHSTPVNRGPVPNDRLQVSDAVAIDPGPARTLLGDVLDERGQPQRRVFVTSFDGRAITIYNPVARVVEARVLTGRGPAALAIDSVNAVGYVAHFTDSYVGIIDLDRRHATYGTIIRALGRASAPRGDE
jgi:DNA-binding beta-propeller fold protein YncE